MNADSSDLTAKREQRPLQRLNSGLPLIVQGSAPPLLRGAWPNGFDFTCPNCQAVLIENTVEGQLWNLSFKCYHCGEPSETPSLPRGRPLPRRLVEIPLVPGVIITGPVDMPNVCLTSTAAVEQRQSETGTRGASFGANAMVRPICLERAALEQLLADLESSLGSLFNRIMDEDSRYVGSSGRPERRHRLAKLVERTRASIRSTVAIRPTFDVPAIGELQALVHFVTRWRNDPRWGDLLGALRHDYEHTLVVLIAASFFHDCGNAIQLVKEEQNIRLPDIWTANGIRDIMALEIKTPDALVRRASLGLDAGSAFRLVRSTVKAAGGGRNRQLPKDGPSLLVLGGLSLAPEEQRIVCQGAQDYLAYASRTGKHHQLVGIVILSHYAMVKLRPPQPAAVSLSALLSVARHPGYAGDFGIEEMPGLSGPRAGIVPVTAGGGTSG
jgi:hypothetical protein